MATVPGQLSVKIKDALGVETSMSTLHDVTTTDTVADLQTWAAAYLPKLDAITDGQITAATIAVTLTLPGSLKDAPAAHSEVEKTGLFNFGQTGLPYKYGIDVPAISDNVIVNGKIDLTNSDITDWISLLTTLTNGIQAISKAFVVLTGLLDALISFRKHRRAESRRSFEVGS